MVNWYSITLGGHTEGWKITVIHTQTILMSSQNKDVVMASITHSRIKDGRNWGLPVRVVNFTQSVSSPAVHQINSVISAGHLYSI